MPAHPNNTLANIEKGSYIPYGLGCGPSSPHRAQCSCPGLGIGVKRGPLQLQLLAPGAPREA
eukprot:14491335-Alexandrium_andersonii.AAC.1